MASMALPADLTRLLRELVQIGIALTSEPDLSTLLDRILTEARRFTRAEAGTLFLREGDYLRFTVVANDVLARRVGEREMRQQLHAQPLKLSIPSVAGYVAKTGNLVNLRDAYDLAPGLPYVFNPDWDQRNNYRTRSMLVVPLQEPSGAILGVLQLINALDDANEVVPFDADYEDLVRALASHAAVAIRNHQLEELSFKDGLTGVFNRRYLNVRLEEEARRHSRFARPVSLVLLDLDDFKTINDTGGHPAGDAALQEIGRVLLENSRTFTVICRYGGDEFAAILVDTSKAGAIAYAERLRGVIASQPIGGAKLTASLGVACLPEDVRTMEELIPAADRALYQAKHAGRNRVGVL
jgi:diguanylate cyclase (GGDEF)-like protein